MYQKEHIYIFIVIVLDMTIISNGILNRTVFVIMSQEAHDQNSTYKQEQLIDSLKKVGVQNPKTLRLHKDLPVLGGWTIFPILAPLLRMYSESCDWFVFLDERSTIDPVVFENLLKSYNYDKHIFIGKSVRDVRVSKVHNYELPDFPFPDFAAGFVFSVTLAKTLAKEVKTLRNYKLQTFTTGNV